MLRNIVKRTLDITWVEDNTEARIDDIMANATETMRHKLGLPNGFDFETPGAEQNLYCAYCLYEWNHCVDEFDERYANDIMQVRAKWEVQQYADTLESGE